MKDLIKRERPGAEVAKNPISGNILIISRGRNIIDAVRAAMQCTKDPSLNDRKIQISCDLGYTRLTIKPKTWLSRVFGTRDLTAVDLWYGLSKKRGYGGKSSMFDVIKEETGKIEAGFKNNTSNNYVSIYFTAIDAALLSRENGGKPIEFKFRGKTVVVDGKTHPEDIENMFPKGQRLRNDPPPPPKFSGYKLSK